MTYRKYKTPHFPKIFSSQISKSNTVLDKENIIYQGQANQRFVPSPSLINYISSVKNQFGFNICTENFQRNYCKD